MKKILVIDDNEMFRFILAEWLKVEGFYPVTADDGYEGIQMAQSQAPDLIFCDVNMPEMDGLQVFHQIKSRQETAHIPFYFLTSSSNLTSPVMRHQGATGVIAKGSEIHKLRQALAMLQSV